MLIFITYATDSHLQYALNLRNSALTHGGFDKAHIYTPADLDTGFLERCQSILQEPIGAGYWLWKPYVIMKALYELCSPGDILVYTDSKYLFTEPIMPLIETAGLEANGIVISANKPNEPSFPEGALSKGDAFYLIGEKGNIMDNQAWAGFIALKHCQQSFAFIGAWQAYAEDPRVITDSPSIVPNFPMFKENRRDQTALSLIAKRWKIPFFHFPKRYLQNIRVPY